MSKQEKIKDKIEAGPRAQGEGYAFLFKPLFFIFSLICASWLVLKIEQLKPSDFGKYRSLFESSAEKRKKSSLPASKKEEIKKLIFEYKNGRIDSLSMEASIEKLFKDH